MDLGQGAAVGGMRLEINTGYSCYLTVARRPWGRFFSLVNLGPGAAVEGIRIEINTGYSCYLTQNLQLVKLETSKCTNGVGGSLSLSLYLSFLSLL